MVMNRPKYLLIHASDVGQDVLFDQLKSINAYHKKGHPQAPFPLSSLGYYVGYHYLITGGKTYQTRLDGDVGAHCNNKVDGVSLNFQSIGICWGGDGDIELPNKSSREALRSLIRSLMTKYGISIDNVKFHRDYDQNGKTCPGTLFTRSYLLGILNEQEYDLQKRQKCEEILKNKSSIVDTLKKLLAIFSS